MGSPQMPDCASSWPARLPSRRPSSNVTVVVGGGSRVGKRGSRGALLRGEGELGHELRMDLTNPLLVATGGAGAGSAPNSCKLVAE